MQEMHFLPLVEVLPLEHEQLTSSDGAQKQNFQYDPVSGFLDFVQNRNVLIDTDRRLAGGIRTPFGIRLLFGISREAFPRMTPKSRAVSRIDLTYVNAFFAVWSENWRSAVSCMNC